MITARRRVLVLAMLPMLLWPGPAAADFEAGMRAANTRNFGAAAREWRPLARAGDAKAQYHLGGLYEAGQGVAPDPAEAARWYERAARQGHHPAQNGLGILYAEGRGVGRDPVRAYAWFEIAARRGNGFAADNRDMVARQMTADEVAAAQDRARDWAPEPEAGR
jgi:TPR repeat protein